MRHRVAGRKLGRTGEHRLALLRNLSTALFEKEKIKTTLAKAKELRPFAERLVTLSKRETLHARRLVLRHIKDRAVVGKLFDTISARYAERPGGYTRILKLGPRRGDHAEMAIIELVGQEPAAEAPAPSKTKRRRSTKATSKKKPAAAEAEPQEKRGLLRRRKKKKTTTKTTTRKKKSTKDADEPEARPARRKKVAKKTKAKAKTKKSSRKT